MTRKTQWNSDALPYDQTIDQVLYDIRRADAGESLLLDSVSIQDIIEDSDGALAFDALVTPYAKLERKMEVLNGVMERTGQAVKPVAMQITDPFKQRGVANVAAIFELSDGQTVSIYFHNPDVTPNKMAGTDEVISWKWLLNKKDITIVVAPERGEDLNIREVARRIMKLAEKNSAAFQRANGKRSETMQRIESLKEETASLEKELEIAQRELEVAKQQAEDSSVANHYSQVILNNLVESFGWAVASPGQSVKKDVGGGETGGELNPTGSREVYGSFDAPRNRYLALQVGFDEIFNIDCRDRDTKEVSEEFNSRVHEWAVSTAAKPVADVVGEAEQVPVEIAPTVEGEVAFKVGDLVHWKRNDGSIDLSRTDKVTEIKKGTFGGFDVMTEEVRTDGEKPKRGNSPGGEKLVMAASEPAKSPGEIVQEIRAAAYAQGMESFANGAKRVVPGGMNVEQMTAWYAGWDAANIAAPVSEPAVDAEPNVATVGAGVTGNNEEAPTPKSFDTYLDEAGGDTFEAAKAFFKSELQGKIIKTVIGDVHMTGSGFKEMKRGMKSDATKAKLVPHVTEILTSGRYDGSTAPHKQRTDGFTAFHFFEKDVEVGDSIITAGVNVGEREGKQYEFNLSAYGLGYEGLPNWDKNKDPLSLPGNEPGADGPLKSGVATTLDATLANNGEEVNEGLNIVILKVIDKATGKRLFELEDDVGQEGHEQDAAKETPTPIQEKEDLTTVDGIARAIQLQVAKNRADSQRKYNKADAEKGRTSNYTEENISAYHEKEISEPVSQGSIDIAQAIIDKNPIYLIGRFVYGSFESSEAVFARATGVKVKGLSRAAKKSALFQWAGWSQDRVDQFEKEAAEKSANQDAAQKVSDIESFVKSAWGWLKSMNVRDGAGTIDGQQYLLRQAAAGYNEVGTSKKGAAVTYGLKKDSALRYVKNKSFNAFLKAAQSFGGLKQALDLVGAVIPAAEIKTPVQIVDSAYQFASATDEFKEWLADSVAKESYSPFVSAKAMDEASRRNGASIEWGLFGGAALDGVNADQEDAGDEVDESEIGRTFEAEDIALDSIALDGIDQDGYVGKVNKGGDTVGRVDIGDDGKAMVFVGATGDKRVVFASGVAAMYSDGDAEMMIDALFTVDANATSTTQAPTENDSKDDVAKAMAALRPFMSVSQMKAVSDAMRGEEKQFFIDKMVEMAGIISSMPETYGQDGKGDDAIAYLHYFMGGMDWYITEKDMEAEQLQAFGLADLGHGGELGYISIVELVGSGAELDFHFQQKTIGQINGKKEMSEAEKSGIELAADNDRLYQEGVQAFEIGMAAFKNGGDGKASQNTEFKQFMTKYPGVGNGTRLRELGQAFRNGYEAAQREGEQPAKDDLPVPVVIAPAPSEDPQMTADRALFQSIIDNTVPDILDASYIDQLEAAYMRHIGNAEMEALFVSAVNAYTAAELAASATL